MLTVPVPCAWQQPPMVLEREQDLEDVYYAPGIHARLVSLGKLEGQGWDMSAYEMAEWSCGIGTGTCLPTSRG
jgi:hypothetical protein